MNNFARAHNSYLEPPDDDPICEDGCGEYMERDMEGEWYCANKFCPLKFQGIEKEMAERLLEAKDTIRQLEGRVNHWRIQYEMLKESQHG